LLNFSTIFKMCNISYIQASLTHNLKQHFLEDFDEEMMYIRSGDSFLCFHHGRLGFLIWKNF